MNNHKKALYSVIVFISVAFAYYTASTFLSSDITGWCTASSWHGSSIPCTASEKFSFIFLVLSERFSSSNIFSNVVMVLLLAGLPAFIAECNLSPKTRHLIGFGLPTTAIIGSFIYALVCTSKFCSLMFPIISVPAIIFMVMYAFSAFIKNWNGKVIAIISGLFILIGIFSIIFAAL